MKISLTQDVKIYEDIGPPQRKKHPKNNGGLTRRRMENKKTKLKYVP